MDWLGRWYAVSSSTTTDTPSFPYLFHRFSLFLARYSFPSATLLNNGWSLVVDLALGIIPSNSTLPHPKTVTGTAGPRLLGGVLVSGRGALNVMSVWAHLTSNPASNVVVG
jgi:hypothetical protein